MEEKKKHLLSLIELLKFPVSLEEARSQTETLSEGELDSVIEMYEAILDYKKTLDDAALATNPEEYKKIKEKYHKDILDAKLQYADEMESVQKETDEQLDDFEEKSEQQIDAVTTDSKKKYEEVEATTDDLALGFKPPTSEN